MIRLGLIGLAVIIAGGVWLARDNEKAMVKCQKRHSFDTCFYTIMR
jgi:hypothetical protein